VADVAPPEVIADATPARGYREALGVTLSTHPLGGSLVSTNIDYEYASD